MTLQPFRQAAALLSTLLLFSQASAQPLPQYAPATQSAFPDEKRAKRAVERGTAAEAAGRLDEALRAYDEAARYAPRDLAVVARGAVLRSRLIREHVETAERLAVEGKVSVARDQLNAALRTDPTNQNVAERLAQMESMQDEDAPPQSTKIPGLPRLKPHEERHSFHLQGDTRTLYEQVAAAFGVKVIFDVDVVARTARLQLENVDFNTAAFVLEAQTNTFWRPVDAATMFVAPDTLDKRRLYGLQVEQSFPLPASANPEEMTELLRSMREITGATRVTLDAKSRTITLRDAPERLRLAGELIRQLERARGELMLEIQLLEVDRNKARQLGITPPASTQALLITPSEVRQFLQATDLANALTILGQILNAKGLSSIPGFTSFGGGYSTFLLTLPGVAANFSDALSLVQSGRQVLLRAQNGKPASIFVGERFPVTLSLLSGSIGTGTGTNPSQNFSFTGVPSSTTFPQTSFLVGNNPVALVDNDFNSDGLRDLAVANQNDSTVSILLNQDKGNFTAGTTIVLPTTEKEPAAIASGVFRNNLVNSNGTPVTNADLLVANAASNDVGVFFGNGEGAFQEAPGSPYAVGQSPSSLVVADFNGDGFLDFAVANTGDNSISVFRGNGQGVFTEFPNSPFALTNNSTVSEKGPIALATGNFRLKTIGANNFAPEVDIAVVNQTTNNVSVLLPFIDNNGDVTFTEAVNSPISVGQSPVAIAAGDLDADGIPDLAVVNQADSSVSVLLGSRNADATFSAAPGSPLPTATTPAGVAIASFTGGTTPDLAVTNKGQGTLGIYLGLGGGTFSNRIEIGTPAIPGALVSAILTSSGLPDVALTALGSTSNQGLAVIIQDSSTFATGTTPAQTPYPGSEFLDLGVKVKATPIIHTNHEVTLQLEFEIRSLSGQDINGIPVISNRTISQTVRVKEDETSVISGLLDNEETRSLVGLPGFANLPGIGYAFGRRNNTKKDTEFLILITPRKLRDVPRTAPSIFAGRGDPGRAGGGPTVPPQP